MAAEAKGARHRSPSVRAEVLTATEREPTCSKACLKSASASVGYLVSVRAGSVSRTDGLSCGV